MRIWIGLIVLAHAAIGEANERPEPPVTPSLPAPTPAAPRRAAAPAMAPAATPETSLEQPAPEPVDTRWFFDAMLGVGSEHLDLGLGVRGGKTLDSHDHPLDALHIGTQILECLRNIDVGSLGFRTFETIPLEFKHGSLHVWISIFR